MGSGAVLPVWDTLVLVSPFVGILGMAMLGLDERLATPKNSSKRRRFFCEVDRKGQSSLSDPDGRLWQKKGREIEGRFTPEGTPRAGEALR
jgi:hypothetical protein